MKHTFIDILSKINADLEREKRWEKSKLRYYLREVLEEQPQKRGTASTYPELTLNKLLFISKLMESNVSPSIKQMKEILAEVSDDEINRIAAGTERLEIGVPDMDESGIPGFRTIKGEFISQEDPEVGRVMDAPIEMLSVRENQAAGDEESAADYMKRHFLQSASPVHSGLPGSKWKNLKLGPDLELRYRKNLTRKQERQLRLAGKFLQSILSEED